jgi:phage terminase large subunit
MNAPAQNPLHLWVERYRNSRTLFFKEVLRVSKLEKWQEDANALLDKGETRLTVRSGHGVGKTMWLAGNALHFLLTRYPCKVAVTAPSAPQLFDALAAEVKIWLKRAETDEKGNPTVIAGILEPTSDRVFMKASPEGCFLTYRTSRRDNPEALQGIHSENVLLIADEASGVEENVFEAAAGSMSTRGAITILAGNPTRATGFFFNTHTKLRNIWKSVRVSCMDSSRVDPAYIEEERAFGEQSNRFRIRVLGEFPLGDDDTLIPRFLVEQAVARKITQSKNQPAYWGVDVARYGSDASTLAKRRANVLLDKVKRWRGLDLMQLCGQIVNEFNETPEQDRPEAIFVDVIGLGAGVVDRLRELGLPAIGVNVSEAPSVTLTKSMRLRDELWSHAAAWFRSLAVQMPDDPETIEELVTPRVAYTSNGKMKVESKDELRSRSVGSPDGADAFCLTFAWAGAVAAGLGKLMNSKSGPLKRQNTRRV